MSLAKRPGFADPRVVVATPIIVQNVAIARRLGAARFCTVTYRLFKLDGLDGVHPRWLRSLGVAERATRIATEAQPHRKTAEILESHLGSVDARERERRRLGAHDDERYGWSRVHAALRVCATMLRRGRASDLERSVSCARFVARCGRIA